MTTKKQPAAAGKTTKIPPGKTAKILPRWTGTKAEYIRQHQNLTPTELERQAAYRGLKISAGYVSSTRWHMRHGAMRPKATPAPASTLEKVHKRNKRLLGNSANAIDATTAAIRQATDAISSSQDEVDFLGCVMRLGLSRIEEYARNARQAFADGELAAVRAQIDAVKNASA